MNEKTEFEQLLEADQEALKRALEEIRMSNKSSSSKSNEK